MTKHVLRLAVFGGAFAVLGLPAVGQDAPVIDGSIVLIEAGLFCPRETSAQEEAPGTERGYIDLIDGVLTADFDTTVVPGELGIGFGIRFQLAPGQGSRDVHIVTTHPPFGSPPVTVERYLTTAHDDSTNASLFTFDFPYEVALGEWSIAVEMEGKVVLSQTFNVIAPEDSFVRASMCDGPALMS